MKKFSSALLTGFALFFSIPTILILASWNAIPGDALYSVKSSLEDVALALTANTRIATAFSVNFTDRRFNEAAILLDKKGSTVGYELLVDEARQARRMILSEQDKKNGTQLVRKIEEYQRDIEARQVEAQNLAFSSSGEYYDPSPAPYPDPDPTPLPSEEKKIITIITTKEVIIEEEEVEEVIENLEEVLEELEEIKIEIEEELPNMEAPAMQSGPDSSAGDEEAPDEADDSAAEEEVSEEAEDNSNKDKDKERPSRNDEEYSDE